jgi:hypothetical protein
MVSGRPSQDSDPVHGQRIGTGQVKQMKCRVRHPGRMETIARKEENVKSGRPRSRGTELTQAALRCVPHPLSEHHPFCKISDDKANQCQRMDFYHGKVGRRHFYLIRVMSFKYSKRTIRYGNRKEAQKNTE